MFAVGRCMIKKIGQAADCPGSMPAVEEVPTEQTSGRFTRIVTVAEFTFLGHNL